MAMKVFLVPVLVKVDVGRLDRYCRLPRYVLEPLARHCLACCIRHIIPLCVYWLLCVQYI